MTKKIQYGIKDAAIVIGILALLFLLGELFIQPARPARDLVFGELGRVHSALTNLTQSASEPPITALTSNAAPAPRPTPLLSGASNGNTVAAPAIQPTNDAMANAVAAAMAAPPIVASQPSSTDDGAPQPVPSLTTAPDGQLVVTVSAPAQPVASRPKPQPYTPAPSPEPDSKPSTADLLATVSGDAPAQSDRGPTSTTALLGVDSDKAAVIRVATARTRVAQPSAPPERNLPARTGERNVSFVVDQSLSMRKNGKTGRALGVLLQMLDAMGPDETFYVLFFHSGGYEGMPGLGPVPATPANIGSMNNWLFSVGHRFGSDPAKGIRRALGMVPAPDTVWLISDGEFSRNAIESIRRANQSVNAHINTVALGSAEGHAAMQQIADENRGICRFVAPPP